MQTRTISRSNRTFMELKQMKTVVSKCKEYSSNRTFMELKYEGVDFTAGFGYVLIVPLWN